MQGLFSINPRFSSSNMATTQEKTMEVSAESKLSQAEIGTKKDISPMEIEDARVVTEDEVQKYSKDDDEAMAAYARYHGPPLVLDEATNKRLLRTIDWHLMPIL
jgi:ACS family allantoate permease-like MFS transporter